MKLSKLTLACLVATAGLSTVPAAYAEKSDGFEFHGYFRAGVLFSENDDFKRAKFPASKERLGRLGVESDSHFEVALQKNFENDGGQKIRIKTRAAANNAEYATNQLGANADATNSEIGMAETFVEFEGVSETGVVWGGKRFYGKDNYIFMTDFFYTDMSGTGVGIEGVELGGNKWDFAYIASDDSGDTSFWGDSNNIMHALHAGVNFGSVELHAMAKYMPDNMVDLGFGNGPEAFAENGYEMTAIVHTESVFGLSDKGFTKYIAQAGKGLGSGNLLGGTLTTYNTYKPGSDYQSWLTTGTGCGTSCLKAVDENDVSLRALAWGGYFFENGVNIFHSLQTQYNDFDNGDTDGWVSAMVRPTFPISENFFIATEAGYMYNYEDRNGESKNSYDYKLTVAPTLVVHSGFGPSPEIRFMASYLDGEMQDGTGKEGDFVVGIQADMWW
ncbi:maltoporin [Vibrio sp. 10N.286.55.E10]|uniref:carbohydrate porin n=1 Tax=Vibrio TaxID=662 RepID=UPI000C8400A4|nr:MULTISPECIES: carbohydrate porin [unclassified Vibrio]CAK3729038.1 Carbohydrate porin [Vibrio crassostreae]MCK8081943.1 carbohydrate porin [Vibrio sp. 1CM24A]PME28891.1 maltoporin [Vibrio sp. 10N.286.55.E10]PME31707.1 maltoporin [Vibrio sp. 10N.286.55.E12]PME69844.1 maltoporin [Vibrio sp. 10N.286.55.C11]